MTLPSFTFEGTFDIAAGVKFNLTGNTLPSATAAVQTGDFWWAQSLGDFDTALTTVLGLGNTAGALLISETAGESMNFNPSLESVYWMQESGSQVSLKYGIAPTPAPGPASAGLRAVRRRR